MSRFWILRTFREGVNHSRAGAGSMRELKSLGRVNPRQLSAYCELGCVAKPDFFHASLTVLHWNFQSTAPGIAKVKATTVIIID